MTRLLELAGFIRWMIFFSIRVSFKLISSTVQPVQGIGLLRNTGLYCLPLKTLIRYDFSQNLSKKQDRNCRHAMNSEDLEVIGMLAALCEVAEIGAEIKL